MQIFAFLLQQAPANGSAPASSSPALSFLPLIFIIAIFYFLVFMPMQRQKRNQKKMLESLEAGSEVLTTGGLVGTIVSLTGDMLILRVKPDNVKLQVSRSAVASLVTADTKKLALEKK